MLTSLSVDEILLPRYINWFTNFRGFLFNMEMTPFCFKHGYSFLICNHVVANASAAFYRLCSWDSALVGVFARSAWSSALSTSVIVSAGCRLLLDFF